MSEIITHTTLNHIGYVQCLYEKSDRLFKSFVRPVAAFDRDGKIDRASKVFCEIAGMAEDDVRFRLANLFDWFNDWNAGLTETARGVFTSAEPMTVVHGIAIPLRPGSRNTKAELERYTEAAFFPMSYDGKKIEYGGILLAGEPITFSGNP